MKKNEGFSSKLFDIFNICLMIFLMALILYPLVYVIAVSFSSTKYVSANMITVFPRGFNLESYKKVFETKIFWIAYKNTLAYTILGTAISLTFTCIMAFVLSRKEFMFKKQINIMVVITMFFSGGLIPFFILIKNLHFYNTLWAIVIPGAISTWNMIIVKTYMQGLPEELSESARIDGANDLLILIKLIIPLSMPVIATIGLFYAVAFWNDYFNPMIFFRDRSKLPVQVILRNMIVEADMIGIADAAKSLKKEKPTSEQVIATTMVVAMIPILCVYPFVQKYFVKGVMIGSLKG